MIFISLTLLLVSLLFLMDNIYFNVCCCVCCYSVWGAASGPATPTDLTKSLRRPALYWELFWSPWRWSWREGCCTTCWPSWTTPYILSTTCWSGSRAAEASSNWAATRTVISSLSSSLLKNLAMTQWSGRDGTTRPECSDYYTYLSCRNHW